MQGDVKGFFQEETLIGHAMSDNLNLPFFLLKTLLTAIFVPALFIFMSGAASEGGVNSNVLLWAWLFIRDFPQESIMGASMIVTAYPSPECYLSGICWVVFMAGFFARKLKLSFLLSSAALGIWSLQAYVVIMSA